MTNQITTRLTSGLALPIIGSPMFIVSGPELVIAQCMAGVIGSFPALNARPAETLDETLHSIVTSLAAHDRANPDRPSAPFAVNLIVNRSNKRLDHDLALVVAHRVPVVITSLGVNREVWDAVHAYGGIVLHDVIHDAFARKAIDRGADGVIAVAAGAGGHASTQSPFALVQEIRQWFDGPLVLGGAVSSGAAVLAAQVLGADLVYMGTRFIATTEANAQPEYKQMLVESSATDIVYSDRFTGMFANYLAPSIVRAGIDDTPGAVATSMSFAAPQSTGPKPWKDIWGAGQGLGAIRSVDSVANVISALQCEYTSAHGRLSPRDTLG